MAKNNECAVSLLSHHITSLCLGVCFPVRLPDSERPLPNSEDLQRLVERFHRAQWITGTSMVSPEPFRMELTPLGSRRLKQLYRVFRGANNDNFPDQSNYFATASGRALMAQFEEAMTELFPPFLSDGEKQTLLGLTLTFAKRENW